LSSIQGHVRRALHLLEHHPKHVTALLAALMLGGGGGAYAVASLGPDPSALPVQLLLEDVQPLSLEVQAEALDAHGFNVFTTDQVRGSDTIDTLLARLQVNDPAAAGYLRRDNTARKLLLGVVGRPVVAEATDGRNLVRLSMRWIETGTAQVQPQFQRLVVERSSAGGFSTRIESVPFTTSLRAGTGVIKSSLFAAVDEAGIPDEVAMQLVDIFGGAIDFHRGMRRGDRFHVVYEMLEADGEPVRAGRVLTVEFVNKGRSHQAVWFKEAGKPNGGYFDFSGKSLESAYLASPMAVSRVTSGFKMRFHPILHTWRQHMGVDYGAPSGTPVRSVGEGRVQFAGWMGGYGNVVQVDHGRGDNTLYAHLSRVDVRVGATVTRGQQVGTVGQTGWATGPHLHFEFRQNGVHKDPLEVARQQQGVELSAHARPDFDHAAGAMRAHLAAAAAAAERAEVASIGNQRD
jgi:murein DD-endopeptidase MepM/ murein hydrolase activator NlpD